VCCSRIISAASPNATNRISSLCVSRGKAFAVFTPTAWRWVGNENAVPRFRKVGTKQSWVLSWYGPASLAPMSEAALFSTGDWATLVGFQTQKCLSFAENWTQNFLSFCLSLRRLNYRSLPPLQSSVTKASSGNIFGCVRFDVLTAVLLEIMKPLKWHFDGYWSFIGRQIPHLWCQAATRSSAVIRNVVPCGWTGRLHTAWHLRLLLNLLVNIAVERLTLSLPN
jgi:hypothetical protein